MLTAAIPARSQHTWDTLDRIAIIESGEPLLPIPSTHNLKQNPIYFQQNIAYALDICVARQSVLHKLQQAADLLPKHLGIMVLDAWRPREVQQAVQDEVAHIIKSRYPHLSPVEQQHLLSEFVAPVGPNFISPHLTGGSVDITLFELATGKWLDMGSDFDEPTARSHTHFYETQPAHPARDNRRLLYFVMTQVGFSNLPTEWWHFDYGNPNWAYYHQQSHAIYGEIHWDTTAC